MVREATAREMLKCALLDAIDWQKSLEVTLHYSTPEAIAARARIRAYERILLRRYSEARTQPEEVRSIALKDVPFAGSKESS